VANGAALEFDPLSVGDITAAMTTLARDDACARAASPPAAAARWN
jgi:alpha-1,3-rhamnosyl/mannosyltransferase